MMMIMHDEMLLFSAHHTHHLLLTVTSRAKGLVQVIHRFKFYMRIRTRLGQGGGIVSHSLR